MVSLCIRSRRAKEENEALPKTQMHHSKMARIWALHRSTNGRKKCDAINKSMDIFTSFLLKRSKTQKLGRVKVHWVCQHPVLFYFCISKIFTYICNSIRVLAAILIFWRLVQSKKPKRNLAVLNRLYTNWVFPDCQSTLLRARNKNFDPVTVVSTFAWFARRRPHDRYCIDQGDRCPEHSRSEKTWR